MQHTLPLGRLEPTKAQWKQIYHYYRLMRYSYDGDVNKAIAAVYRDSLEAGHIINLLIKGE